MATSVLVCGITQSDVSIHFTSGMLRMQTELSRTPGLMVEFEFFLTINDALAYFESSEKHDLCIIIDAQMSVESGFILKNDPTKDFVVASYPLRQIDWDRLKERIVDGTEPVSQVGITYNYDPANSVPERGGCYVRLKKGTYAQLKIFKITKKAIQKLAETHGKLPWYVDGIIDGQRLSPDQRLCQLWEASGETIYADIVHKTINIGPYDYVGCVGTRKQLR